LRTRREDVPLLVKHFVANSARRQSAPEKPVTPEAMLALVNYDWPGNVRELENAIERAFILSADSIDLESLPPKISQSGSVSSLDGIHPTLDEMERRYLIEVLASVDDDKSRAAEILGIDLSTLYRKLKRYEGS
jgi:two-component system response regulator HydG